MFESHPDKPLIEHIQEVTNKATEFIDIKDKDILLSLEIAAKTHDFGKYTTYFQKRLHNSKDKNPLGDHSYISAIFGTFAGQELLGEDSYLPLVIYSVILHHHGNLQELDRKLPNNIRNISNLRLEIQDIEKQLDDMKNNFDSIYIDMKKIGLAEQFQKFIEERPIKKILFKLKKIQFNIDDEKIFYIHQLIYSSLIDGDKMSASYTKTSNLKNVDYEYLMDIYNKKFDNKDDLSLLRREVFDSIQQNIENNYKERIFSITAPTGTGKTLAGFYAARKLSEYHGDRRIIYALPFTSIIDQNYNEIYKLFKGFEDFDKNTSRYIIKHHSLADYDYKNTEIDYDVDQSKLLIEGWNSSIVITTFVQFFESILGVRNKMLKKLHSVKGSIILLDELQSIPIKFWPLIDYLLKKICKELDCRVITMTATKPVILEDSIELLDDYEKYFKALNRVKLTYEDDPVTIKDFTDEFIDDIENKSYLVVCNTIGQSLELYKKLTDLDREVIYLSTNIVPKERKERIEYIKKNMSNKPIVISTQVIEAGVDLDFDVVIRDLAPLDSIIQAAGRCNRNNKFKGKVKVVKMINEKEELYGNYIYGSTLLNITDKILKDKKIEESNFLDIIQKYFKEAYEKKNTSDKYKEYKTAIERLDFEEIKSFSVIENRPNYIDVFFEIDEESVKLMNEYKEVKQMEKSKEKYEKLLRIYPEMRKYMISLPDKYIKELDIDRNYNIIRMPIEAKERLYKDDTGLNRDDIGASIFL